MPDLPDTSTMTDPTGREPRPAADGLEPDLVLLGDETAREARDYLTVVREVATGSSPETAIPLLLLAVAQVLVTGTRLGAITDIVPARQFEPDLGSDEDVERLREQLASLLRGLDEYAEIVDPLTTAEISGGQLSGDLAEIAASLMHGLRHHADGEISEALWWWQFSYLSSWGARAASALRVLQSIVTHIRLDADDEVVAEAQFDALFRGPGGA